MIPGAVTREMTPYEMKFALLVENTLNALPDPGMRQMIVEGLYCILYSNNFHKL